MHYSGCTVASVDTGSSPLTCSIHVPGVGTRDGVAVDQVRRLARPEAAEHDELEDRIMTEVRILRERLAAGSGEEDEEAMRAVFERRIMLLEEEMSSRRRGPERLMARGGPGSRGGGSRQVIRPVLSLFTLLRPYLAHFLPVFSRCLRVFTASPRRFQRAPSRSPGPRNSRHRCPNSRKHRFSGRANSGCSERMGGSRSSGASPCLAAGPRIAACVGCCAAAATRAR